jgi:tetratricopeptide (TPR) repeat protein
MDFVRQVSSCCPSQFASGKTEAGLKMLEENIAVYRKIPSGYDGYFADNLHMLSSAYWQLGRFEEAINLGKESVKICERTFGVDHFRTLAAIKNLACAYMEGKRYAEAEKHLQKAIQGYEDYLGKINEPRAMLEERLGTLYVHEERFDEALYTFADALEIRAALEDLDAISVLSNASSMSLVFLLQWKKNVLLPALQKEDGKYTMKHSTHITDSELHGLFLSMQNYKKVEKMFLKNLAIMLFRYGKLEASRKALQAEATLEKGEWTYSSNYYCNGCGKDGPLIRSRFVCMECTDVDLCEKCRELYEEGTLQLSDCTSHIFLDATLPPSNQIEMDGILVMLELALLFYHVKHSKEFKDTNLIEDWRKEFEAGVNERVKRLIFAFFDCDDALADDIWGNIGSIWDGEDSDPK